MYIGRWVCVGVGVYALASPGDTCLPHKFNMNITIVVL